jgi:phytoene dehydrogenase-like protein
MAHDVVVVGGGVGGLTTAALLAARGLDVCLLERGPRVGGCVASLEKSGFKFETGAGLYSSWGPGETHARVFSELKAEPPEAREASPAYAVRLGDGTEVRVGGSAAEFEETLRAAFPECAGEAVDFYGEAGRLGDALRRAAARTHALVTASRLERARLVALEARVAPRVLSSMNHTAAQHLTRTSTRFRRFIDAQLHIFAQRGAEECAYLYAAVALSQPLRGMYTVRGGGQALADALAASLKRNGGSLRLNQTALRVALDAGGRAAGVDLLSGERVEARRAVVSNLTVWGHLRQFVGGAHTPPEVRSRVKALRGRGAYLIFLALDEGAAQRLSTNHVIAPANSPEEEGGAGQFMFCAAPRWDARAPEGMRAATLCAFTEPEAWFAFHEDEAGHERMDQETLEDVWRRLHASMPELGDGVEVMRR